MERAAVRYNSIGQFEQSTSGGGDIAEEAIIVAPGIAAMESQAGIAAGKRSTIEATSGGMGSSILLEHSPTLPPTKQVRNLRDKHIKNKVLKLPKLTDRNHRSKMTLDDPVGLTLSVKRSKIRHLMELQENYLSQNVGAKKSQRPLKIDSPFRKHRDEHQNNSSKLSLNISKKNSVLEEAKMPSAPESVQQVQNDGLITSDVDRITKEPIEIVLDPHAA
eukprot:CAMPEP_0170502374 /NCGR_PEP_ID=MMETSP0208-20121228/41307_1 /TAXON_ID=197538 /ORGANISM="Strombidium inclinatum, Strain S3" /LENGTH=218 /DNA_ID=CAMNT_0010781421 /DNA_START=2169 /DNA_END=2825 /DNA_ORIENTATION=+